MNNTEKKDVKNTPLFIERSRRILETTNCKSCAKKELETHPYVFFDLSSFHKMRLINLLGMEEVQKRVNTLISPNEILDEINALRVKRRLQST